jgi:hypothetical protein
MIDKELKIKKLGANLEQMSKSDGWKDVLDYIRKNKETVKEIAISPGFKDFETYKSYVKAYEAYDDIEQFVERSINAKNKLIENEQSEPVADAAETQ